MTSRPHRIVTGFCIPIIFLLGCTSPGTEQSGGDDLTVGTVQKEIRVGMSGADVVAILGSPNVVTTDEQRREVWVYDKVSTDTVSSRNEGGVFLLILGGSVKNASKSTTQKTLTVIIKFDDQGKVRDFAYHSSKF